MKSFALGFLIVLSVSQTGCSLFFGNIKPMEAKSSAYRFLDLSTQDSSWTKVESQSVEPAKESEGSASDIAFQSQKSAAVISINSACRSYEPTENPRNLRGLTRELLMGTSDISFQEEKEIQVSDTPALQTTLKGRIDKETVKLRTVVLQKGNCVYDLMYVTRPDRFGEDEELFSRFVSSFVLNGK